MPFSMKDEGGCKAFPPAVKYLVSQQGCEPNHSKLVNELIALGLGVRHTEDGCGACLIP